jgi:tubulin monoglycylase TTLL3/8
MQKNQFVNHFEKNSELTRKVSLNKNLKNLVWFRSVDINSFFPRCYDLSDANDTECFADDFKTTKAEALLKRYLDDWEIVSLEKLNAAMNVIERKLRSFAEILDAEKV